MRVAQLRRELTARWRASPTLQDRVTAASTFAVGAALDLVGFAGFLPWPWLSARAAPAWVHVVPLAVGSLSLLVKRRHPVAVLGVCVLAVLADVAIGGSFGSVLVLFDAMFAVGLYGSARARAGQASAVFVVIGTATVMTALATRNLQTTVGVGLQMVALLVLPLWWSANVRVQRELGELTVGALTYDVPDYRIISVVQWRDELVRTPAGWRIKVHRPARLGTAPRRSP